MEPELGGEVEGDDAGEDHGGDAQDDVLQEGDRQPRQHQAGGAGQGADQQELGKRGKKSLKMRESGYKGSFFKVKEVPDERSSFVGGLFQCISTSLVSFAIVQ